MKNPKKVLIIVAVLAAALAVNFLAAVFLHAGFLCVTDQPADTDALVELFPDCEGARVLDTYADADAAMTLIRKADDSVFLLVFQKNLFLKKYQLLGAAEAPDGFENAIKTAFLRCPFRVENQLLVIDEEAVSHSLQPGSFFTCYGLNVLLLLAMEAVIYRTGVKQKLKKKGA